jgi:hypothetical protein
MTGYPEKSRLVNSGAAEQQILLDADRRRKAMAELTNLLLEGVEGPMTEMTHADWAQIRRKGYEHLQSRR